MKIIIKRLGYTYEDFSSASDFGDPAKFQNTTKESSKGLVSSERPTHEEVDLTFTTF